MNRFSFRYIALLICLSLLALFAPVVEAQSGKPTHVTDPFADPKHDPFNPLKYIASDVLAGVAFALLLLVAFIHTLFMWRQGGKFMLSMLIGEYTFAAGIATRFGLHVHPDSSGNYIIQYLLVVLSPCAFIAAEYVLLGRIARWLNCDNHLLVRSTRITLIFVLSDVTTFLIQAIGGGVSASSSNSTDPVRIGKIGSNIFLAGLVIQLLSFFIFFCVFLRFIQQVHLHAPQVWAQDKVQGIRWSSDWRALAAALFISCVCVLIRCIYRVIEISQGFSGSIAQIEGLFYGLDTLPLFIAVAIYVPFWPGRFIPPTVKAVHEEKIFEGEQASQ